MSYGFSGERWEQVGWRDMAEVTARFDILKPLLASSKRLLDVGCGTGLLLDWIVKQDVEIDYRGFDASEEFVEAFNKAYDDRLGEDVWVQDAMVKPVRERADIVAVFGVAADLYDDKYRTLALMLDNLRPAARKYLVMDFWDENEFRPLGGGDIGPQTWDLNSVAQIFKGVLGPITIKTPVSSEDFVIIAEMG